MQPPIFSEMRCPRTIGDILLYPHKLVPIPHDMIVALLLPKSSCPAQQTIDPACRITLHRLKDILQFMPFERQQQPMNMIGHHDEIATPQTVSIKKPQRLRHQCGRGGSSQQALAMSFIQLTEILSRLLPLERYTKGFIYLFVT